METVRWVEAFVKALGQLGLPADEPSMWIIGYTFARADLRLDPVAMAQAEFDAWPDAVRGVQKRAV